MIDHNHFICHFIFGGHLLNIPHYLKQGFDTAHLLKSACVFSNPSELLLLLLITINISRSTNMFSCLSEKFYRIEDRNRMPDMRIWYLPCVKTKIYPSKIFLLG